MAKTTVLIDVNIGAQVPPETAWMIWAAPFMFDSGNTVVLPVGAPLKLVAGVGQVQVDAGPWVVTAAGPGFTKTQAWMVPESDVPVQFGDLIEITDEGLLGFGPTWAARAELAALTVIAYVEAAAGSAADALAYRNQAQAIADAMPTTTDALMATVFGSSVSAFRMALESWGDEKFLTSESASELYGPDAIALAMGNPESALNSETISVVEDVLGGGVSGLQRFVDARDDLSVARPTWAGQVVWLINENAANPVHLVSGDAVWEVAVEEVPWTPTLLANKLLWFDAQTLVLANGAAVASWPDLVAGQNAVQADAAKRPTFATAKINGHPAVVSDGIDDALIATLATDHGTAFTVYAVAGTDLADNPSGADFLWDAIDTVPNYARGALYRGSDESYNLQRGTTITSAASAWTTGPKLLKAVYNGATSSLTVNGTVVASGTLAVSAFLHSLSLFTRAQQTSGNFWTGFIGELLAVAGVPTSDVDTQIQNYFTSHWSL